MVLDYDKIYTNIWKSGNSLVITIPTKLAKYADIKEGDDVKILIQKIPKKKEEEN